MRFHSAIPYAAARSLPIIQQECLKREQMAPSIFLQSVHFLVSLHPFFPPAPGSAVPCPFRKLGGWGAPPCRCRISAAAVCRGGKGIVHHGLDATSLAQWPPVRPNHNKPASDSPAFQYNSFIFSSLRGHLPQNSDPSIRIKSVSTPKSFSKETISSFVVPYRLPCVIILSPAFCSPWCRQQWRPFRANNIQHKAHHFQFGSKGLQCCNFICNKTHGRIPSRGSVHTSLFFPPLLKTQKLHPGFSWVR